MSLDESSANRRECFDTGPLSNPIWVAALALLLVNDNLLKGSGFLPGWLTGKLSDFAFVVVAPVLLCSLLPRAVPARRWFAFASVTIVYCAAELSPGFSRLLEQLASRFGMAWKLWPDPSDLMALAVLPVAWRLVSVQPRPALAQARRILEPALLIIGALACLATGAPPSHTHYPFLANFTGGKQTVTMTWLLRRVNCPGNDSVVKSPSLELPAVAATLNANDLDDPHRVTLGDQQRAALDAPPADDARMAETCPNRSVNRGWPFAECAVVLVSVEGGPTALVATPMSWTEYEDDSGCGSSPGTPCEVSGKGRKDTLALTLDDGKLELSPSSKMAMVPISLAEIAARAPDPNGCRVQRDDMARRLDESKSCEVDSDCCVATATGGRPIPMDEVCSFYVRRDSPLIPYPDPYWVNQCFPGIRYNCDGYHSVQPAVCRNGRCGPTCLDVSAIPMCGTCPASWSEGHSCEGSGQDCLLNNGKRCACLSNMVQCAPAVPAVPGCPLVCLREQPGCFYEVAPRDAGAGDSHPDGEAKVDR